MFYVFKIILCAVFLSIVIPAQNFAFADETVKAVDGDGLRIGNLRIRLWGIDAPELDQTCEEAGAIQPCGEDARFLLGALVMAGDLKCETKDTDKYGRTVAQCSAGGYDLAAEMVRQGYALDWPRYSHGFYAGQETEAREHKRGIWAGEFVRPWEWRHEAKNSKRMAQ